MNLCKKSSKNYTNICRNREIFISLHQNISDDEKNNYINDGLDGHVIINYSPACHENSKAESD
jgi:hypothetical protein